MAVSWKIEKEARRLSSLVCGREKFWHRYIKIAKKIIDKRNADPSTDASQVKEK